MPDKPPIFRVKTTKRREDRPSAYARGYGGKGWQLLRKKIYTRDMGICQSCARVVAGRAAHIDHIKPKAQGGQDTMDNLQLLCSRCHGIKTREEDRAEGQVGGFRYI